MRKSSVVSAEGRIRKGAVGNRYKELRDRMDMRTKGSPMASSAKLDAIPESVWKGNKETPVGEKQRGGSIQEVMRKIAEL